MWWVITGALIACWVFYRIGWNKGFDHKRTLQPNNVFKHQEVLKYFLHNETNLGMYCGQYELSDVRSAMWFFVHNLYDEIVDPDTLPGCPICHSLGKHDQALTCTSSHK